MSDSHEYPLEKPRTLDKLEILDCMEIIVQDLARYNVPVDVAMRIIREYFMPLYKVTDEFKKEYGAKFPEELGKDSFVKFINTSL